MRRRSVIVGVTMLVMLFNLANVVTVRAGSSDPAAVALATRASDAWLKLVDETDYEQSWEDASSLFKSAITERRWSERIAAVREPMGKVVSRKIKTAHYATSLPGAPDGQYVVIEYTTSFQNKKSAIETVTPMLDRDGGWHVSGYFIN
jgi:hypothetical protein